MSVYEDYINDILVKYLQTPNGTKFLKAFENVSDELLEDAQQVRGEGLIQECSPDTLSYHFQNTYTIASPFETSVQARAYLKGLFDTIWKRNGSPQHLLEELKRFGIPNAKIWTWTDLIQAGIPSAFGGNYTTIQGGPLNTAMLYLPNADLGGPGWTVMHTSSMANQPLTIDFNIGAKTLVVNLATNTTMNTSTAKDVFNALNQVPNLSRYIFFAYGGDGLGITPGLVSPRSMAFCYYTYYIIDIYDGTLFNSFVKWNDPNIFWNDGTTIWDGISPFAGGGFIGLLREVIRRATPSTMSCRFLRSFVMGVSNSIPIADQWEEDANGNIVDFYTTHY